MKGFEGPVAVMIITAFGIILTFVLMSLFWGDLLGLVYGSCYGGAYTELRELDTDLSSKIRGPDNQVLHKLAIGKCISGVAFVNGRNDPAYADIVRERCNEHRDYRSYILGIPAKDDDDAICREMEREFSLSGYTTIPRGFPEVKNAGSEPYCLLLSAVETTGGGYNYRIDMTSCVSAESEEEE